METSKAIAIIHQESHEAKGSPNKRFPGFSADMTAKDTPFAKGSSTKSWSRRQRFNRSSSSVPCGLNKIRTTYCSCCLDSNIMVLFCCAQLQHSNTLFGFHDVLFHIWCPLCCVNDFVSSMLCSLRCAYFKK